MNKPKEPSAVKRKQKTARKVSESPGAYQSGTTPGEDSHLAQRINYLAERMGRARLAAAATVSETQICRYIAGQNEPRMSIVVRLASSARVSVDWLMTGRGTVFIDDKAYLPEIDSELLVRILAGLEALLEREATPMEARTKAEFAASVYRHAVKTIPDEQRRLEMVDGFIDLLHPLIQRKTE